MNGVDIAVVVCVVLFVLAVIVVRFILPLVMKKCKKNKHEETYTCANCKRH